MKILPGVTLAQDPFIERETMLQRASQLSSGSLVARLANAALELGAQTAFTFLSDGEKEAQQLSFAGLHQQAQAIAARLSQRCRPGDRALLLYQPGLEFISGFFGCLYAGIVAVPAYPPKNNRHMGRLQAILNDAGAKLALTEGRSFEKIKTLFCQSADLQGVEILATDQVPLSVAAGWQTPIIKPETLAFLQYTSGSTGLPKGVMVSHGNLAHNSELIRLSWGHNSSSVMVSWLPVFHDLGLIAGVLQPVWTGFSSVLMAPNAFLQKPLRWLQAISRYRGTTSCAPNFAYDLCVRKITEEEKQTLDLSSWKLALNAAEPVRYETLERFAEAFKNRGFQRGTLFPGYGLAEGTLQVCVNPLGQGPVYAQVSSKGLEKHRVEPALEGDNHWLVGCGEADFAQEILVVNPESRQSCRPEEIGEIWVKGPSVARGYWQKPKESRETFEAFLLDGQGPFLRTGDLGFIKGGQVFITGRLKDLIIIRGANHYPQDIEASVQKSHMALRPGCGAAFSVEVNGEERLVIVQEVERHQEKEAELIFKAVRQAIAEEHELSLHAMVLIAYGSLPKTSSGKIQRRASKEAFLKGSLESLAEWRGQGPRQESKATEKKSWDPAQTLPFIKSFLAAKFELPVEKISDADSVYSFGLDSLALLQFSHELQGKLGVEIPLSLLIEGLNLAELAQEINQRVGQRAVSIGAESAFNAPAEWPLSFNQKALWFLQDFSQDSKSKSRDYNVFTALEFTSPVENSLIRSSLQLIVDRHPSLRSRFQSKEGRPVQIVQPDLALSLEEKDFSAFNQEQFMAYLKSMAREPMDLQTGPLFRAELLTGPGGSKVLALLVHHIIFDFWSFGLLMEELNQLYSALAKGSPIHLPALKHSPLDHIHYQNQICEGASGEAAWSYWQQKLGGALPQICLPFRAAASSGLRESASEFYYFPGQLLARLKELCQREQVSLYLALLTAYEILLSKLSGQKDLIIGTPLSGRDLSEWSACIGYFVNTVALRTDLSRAENYVQALALNKRVLQEALDHSYPFVKVVERLQPERQADKAPIFQHAFVLQNFPFRAELGAVALGQGAEVRFEAFSVRSLLPLEETAQLETVLMVADYQGGLGASLQYQKNKLSPEAAKFILSKFENLLENLIKQPHLHLDETSLGVEDLAQQARKEAAPALPSACCASRLFESQAAQAPRQAALIFGQTCLSYEQVNQKANQMARWLRHHGVGQGSAVGICLPRSLESVIAVLAIWKAGAYYVPLDPSYPRERLEFMLEDSHVRVVICDEDCPLPQRDYYKLCPATLQSALAQESAENLNGCAAPQSLAYMIYTSGSSGKPKGVLLEHRGLVHLAACQNNLFKLEGRSRVLQFASLSFDASVWEISMSLLNGAALVMAPKAVLSSPLELGELLRQERISHATLPPTMLTLLEAGDFSALECVISAGEACSKELAQAWSRGRRFFNAYGPTESTVCATVCEYDPACGEAPSIGKPLPGFEVHLLDEQLQAVEPGEVGELYIGGIGLARGYHQRPELNQQKFIANPFGPGRLYRSGDLARRLPDGNIAFVGRVDFQVKIRGFRVELEEIEAAMVDSGLVRQAAVLALERQGEKELVAYVVPKDGNGWDAKAALKNLKSKLPDYMVPARFLVLEEFPLLPNGKVDRKALAEGTSNTATEASPNGKQTGLQEKVLAIWEEVMGLSGIDPDENFFDLGGHSLMAVRLAKRIHEQLGIKLSTAVLFKEPTARKMAEYLEKTAQQAAPKENCLVPLQASGTALPLFLVHPMGGNISCFVELAKHLGKEQPLYAFKARGLQGESQPFLRIEEMAAAYVHELKAVQAHGPYRLGGWSMGGVVAFEMARQLQEQGEVVEQLLLFDSLMLNADRRPLPAQEDAALRQYFLKDLAAMAGGNTEAYSDILEPLFNVFKAHYGALFNYVPRQKVKWITLFRAFEKPENSGDPEMGWGPYAELGLDIRVVPGSHYSMLQAPQVRVLAERLKACLAELDASHLLLQSAS